MCSLKRMLHNALKCSLFYGFNKTHTISTKQLSLLFLPGEAVDGLHGDALGRFVHNAVLQSQHLSLC